MWKAELKLIELSFRGPKRKNREQDSEPPRGSRSIRLDTRRGQQYQAKIPEKQEISKDETKKIEDIFKSQLVEKFESMPTEPVKFQTIQHTQKPMNNSDPNRPPIIVFESGPFYRVLDVITGIDEKCKEGECIASKNKSIKISAEEINEFEETGDVKKSTVEKFGYFTAMIEKEKKDEEDKIHKILVPYFVHTSTLRIEPQLIKKQEDVKNSGILYILKKENQDGISVYILYKNEDDASHLVKWFVYRNSKTKPVVELHPKMQEYFENLDKKGIMHVL